MKFGIYVILDTLANKYVHLFVEDNHATAQRTFLGWCASIPQAEDFKLYYAGVWNTKSGEIDAYRLEFVADGTKDV